MCTVVGLNATLIEDKMGTVHYRVNVNILASTGVPFTVGAQSIVHVRRNLVNCRVNISAHRRRRKLRFFLFERSWLESELKF